MPLHTIVSRLKGLHDDTPDVPANPCVADLGPFRDRIDALDIAILGLLNERSRCANNIGAIKKRLDMPVYVPSREKAVLANVVSHNDGPISNGAVVRLFERIIDETRALERHLFQDDPDESSAS